MALVVLDSTNTAAVLADAQGVVEEQKAPTSAKPEAKPEDKPEAKPVEHEEEEDEHGTTEEQRKELSAKMLKAIGKKHRQMKEAEEFAAAQYNERKLAERRAAEMERRLMAMAQPETEKQPEAKPERHKFATEEEYTDALSDWKVDQKFAQREAEAQARAQAEHQQAIIEAAKQRLATAIELVPDFKEVTESADVMIPPVVASYMQKSELFAELGYYFAKNPDVAVSLSKLAGDAQLVKVGKIEAMLKPFGEKPTADTHGEKPSAKDGERKPAKPSIDETDFSQSKPRNAAPVIKPISSSDGAQVEVEPSDMNTRETIQAWQRQNKANLGLRRRH